MEKLFSMHEKDVLTLPGSEQCQMVNFRRNPVDSPWAGELHQVGGCWCMRVCQCAYTCTHVQLSCMKVRGCSSMRVCECAYTCTHGCICCVRMYTCTHMCVRMCTYERTHVHMCAYACTRIRVHLYTCTHMQLTYTQVRGCLWVVKCACVCVCVCVCVCTHA